MSPKTCIGTSGWQYAHWKGPFYEEGTPSDEMLDRYAERLAAVEVNAFFYGLPDAESVEHWRDATPDDFVFAVKASRYLTHMKKLKDPADPVSKLLDRAEVFGRKLGPVLLQLPPNWRFNGARLDEALEAFPKHLRLTVEMRDHSWICDEGLDILRKHNAAFCVYELAGYRTHWHATADFGYVRMHGPADEKYRGEYSRRQLRTIAGHLEGWLGKGMDVYCFFDNDEAGHAANNAVELARMFTD
ncbi:MAG: DUF72 domain-containing protein [Oceanidesulfovibrio sp.]